MKNPNWKQPTPRMQLVAILMGIEGHASNIEIASRNPQSAIRIQELCEQAQGILERMPEGDWDRFSQPCPHCGKDAGMVNGGEGYWYPRRDCIVCGKDTTK